MTNANSITHSDPISRSSADSKLLLEQSLESEMREAWRAINAYQRAKNDEQLVSHQSLSDL